MLYEGVHWLSQFGCSIAQATERHGASLCGIQNRLRVVFHRGEPLFLGNSKKANAERRSAIGLFLALFWRFELSEAGAAMHPLSQPGFSACH